jgi:hypothetical protein
MKRLLGLGTVVFLSQDPVRFTVAPRSITAGDSVVVSWKVAASDSVFISDLGMVAGAGRATIYPTSSRTVYLVGRGVPPGQIVRAADLTVGTGARGNDLPADGAFVVAQSFSIAGRDASQILGDVDRVLQRTLSYPAPDWVRRPTGIWRITTATRERPDMVLRSERTIGLRRVAYRVEVNEGPDRSGAYHCTIASVVQYRKRIERDFRPEPSDTLYRREIDRLAQLLGWAR